jgi:hypothetical protein
MASLEENGHWERLAAEPAGEGRWRVASIPLFAYHLSPGDVVEAAARPGEYPVVTRAVERSGRWVLRAIVADGADEDSLAAECARLGGEIGRHPWEGMSMFAVAVDGDDAARAMEEHLAERETEGALSYETGW